MKKTTFNISFDEDKASALVPYLSQKGTTAEAELERALDALYTKTVPAGYEIRHRVFLCRAEGKETKAPQNRAYGSKRGERQ